ncbi:MAG: hypothetical protein WC683_09835 [bacterium]
MPRADAMQQMYARFAAWKRSMTGLSTQAQAQASKLLNEYAAELVRATMAGTSPTGPALTTLDTRLLGTLENKLANLVTMQGQLQQELAQHTLKATARGMAEAYGGFGVVTPGAIASAQTALETFARKTGNIGFDSWTGRFQNAGSALLEGLKKDLTSAQLHGWSQSDLARAMLRRPEFNFKNLPPVSERAMNVFTRGGTLTESQALVNRAYGIAETEAAYVRSRDLAAWTEGSSIEYCFNANEVPVDEDCIAATAAGVILITKMIALYGDTPRHPNCDSEIVPVPSALREQATDLQKAQAEELAAA